MGLKVVFMGTPDFAVASLRALCDGGEDVVGVITSVDKPAGRGKRLRQSAVKQFALERGLKILQPKNLKNESFLEELRSLEADLQVVVAFRMLPAVVFDMPRLGSINLHGSLLPQYRGAAPINWAIVNGEARTGVTTFFIKQEIDTGKIIYQAETDIAPNENAGELHDRLMEIGAKLVVKTVEAVESGDYPQIEQEVESDLKSAPKIHKEDTEIDWSASMTQVHNFVRGMSPYPAAYTIIDGLRFKIFEVHKLEQQHDLAVGTYQTDNKSFLRFAVTDGWIEVKDLQMEGRKRMSIQQLLQGYDFPI